MEPIPADPLDLSLSRRRLLRGAAALGLLGAAGGLGLAGCGSDGDDDDDAADTTTSEPMSSERTLVLMAAPGTLPAGEPIRLPLGVGDSSGALLTDAPDALSLRVQDAETDEVVQDAVDVSKHDAGLERAFYPLVLTVPAAGFYRVVGEVDGEPIEAAFEVSEPDAVVVPRPGRPLPPTPTPTSDDPQGVDPICTRDPACALHEVDLEDVLGTSPVAVLVSTPAFCQTAICGPVLDLFVAAAEAHPDVTFVHVEPYASGAEVEENGPSADNLSPAVEAWSLPFEPCLFVVDADGNVVERLDVIYDADELDAALVRVEA